MLTIVEIAAAESEDLAQLFRSNDCLQHCACTWFLQAVSAYHANTAGQNWALLQGQVDGRGTPLGLLAYHDGEPVAWCALGPRSRYARALRTPTYAGRDPSEDDAVWLVPCFFVKPEHPKFETMSHLLARAIETARAHGATALEGFPFSGSKLRTTGDTQVGIESVFHERGFEVSRRPSSNRVVMRLELQG